MMHGKPEKRKFPRIKPVRFAVEYRLDGTDFHNRVDIVNISAGGLCFLRNSILKTGDELVINFTFPEVALSLRAVVLRIIGREVGVRFEDEKEKIDSFLKIMERENITLVPRREEEGDISSRSRTDDFLDIEPV